MENQDQIRISNDVILTNAQLALADEIGIEKASKKSPKNKGISIDVIDDKIYVGVELNVSYGTKIPELSGRIQQKIRSSVENMIGMEVAEVNINIASMNIEKTSKEA